MSSAAANILSLGTTSTSLRVPWSWILPCYHGVVPCGQNWNLTILCIAFNGQVDFYDKIRAPVLGVVPAVFRRMLFRFISPTSTVFLNCTIVYISLANIKVTYKVN